MKKYSIAIGILLAACAIASPLYAKGPPREVVISGPGIEGEIVVRDTSRLENLGMAGLMVIPESIGMPSGTGPGYTLIRDGWDEARYYPDLSGAPGYVYYVGLLNGSAEYDGHWFAATPAGDAAMRRILAAHGITFDAAGYHVSAPSQLQPLKPFQEHHVL